MLGFLTDLCFEIGQKTVQPTIRFKEGSASGSIIKGNDGCKLRGREDILFLNFKVKRVDEIIDTELFV